MSLAFKPLVGFRVTSYKSVRSRSRWPVGQSARPPVLGVISLLEDLDGERKHFVSLLVALAASGGFLCEDNNAISLVHY